MTNTKVRHTEAQRYFNEAQDSIIKRIELMTPGEVIAANMTVMNKLLAIIADRLSDISHNGDGSVGWVEVSDLTGAIDESVKAKKENDNG